MQKSLSTVEKCINKLTLNMNEASNLKSPLLSGKDMLHHHTGNYDFHTRIHRLSRLEEEAEHQSQIAKIKDDFRRILSQQRVGKAETYSLGEWDNNRRRIRVNKVVGKWHIFGYLEDNIRYLNGYEALHLLEMNRLIVYWDTVAISLQQAYSLFLGYPESLSLEQYIVYNTLMRAGFYVLKYDSTRQYHTVDDSLAKKMNVEEKCVWKNLYHILRQPHPLVEEIELEQNMHIYNTVRQSMQNFNEIIATQRELEPNKQRKLKKRRQTDSESNEVNQKRLKSSDTLSGLNNGQKSRLERFIELFAGFDVVDGTQGTNVACEENQTTLSLHFDVFPSDGTVFRKSHPVIPEYRIIVRLSSEPLLNSKDISTLYLQQAKPEVPILLMQVAETLSIHCFLYSFYRLPRNLITTATDVHNKPLDDCDEDEANCDSSHED